jgi:O-antigen/teichoic acid export membrane protein
MIGTTRILGNTVVTILSVVVPGLLGLWSLKPLFQLLGAETFTLLSLFWVYTSHLGFFDLGISRNLGIELPKLPQREKSILVNDSIRKGLVYSFFGILVVAVILFLVPVFNPQFLEISHCSVMTILLVWVPLAVIQMIVRGIFEASESFISASVFRAYNQCVLFLVPWLMALWGYHDIFHIVVFITVARVLSLFPAMYWLKTKFTVEVIGKIERQEVLIHRNNQWITLSNLAGIVNGSLDRFVLMSVLGTQAIGAYVFAQDFGIRILVLSSSFALVLLPFFSRNQSNLRNHTWVKLGMGLILLSHIALGLVLFFGQSSLIHGFSTMPLARQVINFFWIFLLGITANGMGHILLSALHSQRELKKPALWHVISAVLYIPLLYWLLQVFGLTGAALLWSVRSVVDTIVLYILWKRKNHPLISL